MVLIIEPRMPWHMPLVDSDKNPIEISFDPTKFKGEFDRLSSCMSVFRDIASRNSRNMRQAANDRLNRAGRTVREFKKGDNVAFFIPPTVRDDWKPKHMLQFRLGVVVERVSRSVYIVADIRNGRRFKRSIVSVYLYKKKLTKAELANAKKILKGKSVVVIPSDTTADQSDILDLDNVAVGDLLAVLDDPEDNVFWVGKLIEIIDSELVLHYYGTTAASSTDLKKVQFRLVYIDNKDKRPVLRKLRKNRCKPWTARIPCTQEYVVATGVQLTASGTLTVKFRNKLQRTGLTHAVMT